MGRVWRDEPEVHLAHGKPGLFLFGVVSGSGGLQQARQRWDLQVEQRCWLVDIGQSRIYEPVCGQRLETAGVRFSGPGMDAWLETPGGAGEFHFSSPQEMRLLGSAQKRLLRMVTRRPAG